MRLRELAKRSSLTDWLIASFTFVLAGASIYQFVIMGSQLDTMRKDERPWVKIDFTLSPLPVNQPITCIVQVVNNGKTPDRAISADIAIERVKNGEQPRLDYGLAHSRFTTGLLFPTVPRDVPITMVHPGPNGATENDLLMQSELEDFQHLRIFFVTYATVHYKDFFGVDHWTKMCMASTPPGVSGTFTGQNCTNYGDVDTN